ERRGLEGVVSPGARLADGLARPVGPRHTQARDVLRVDLGQRRVPSAAGVVAVARPIAARDEISAQCGQAADEQERDDRERAGSRGPAHTRGVSSRSFLEAEPLAPAEATWHAPATPVRCGRAAPRAAPNAAASWRGAAPARDGAADRLACRSWSARARAP